MFSIADLSYHPGQPVVLMEWGLNPATVRAIASVATAIGVIFAWLSLRERKKRRQAVEREMAVGVFDFDFLPAFRREGRDEDALFLLLKKLRSATCSEGQGSNEGVSTGQGR